MNVTTIGIDLAKTVFSIHGTDQHGKVVVRKLLNRPKILAFFAQLPPCLIGMEACSGAHYWARELTKLDHDARIIAPRFVAPYRKAARTINSASGPRDWWNAAVTRKPPWRWPPRMPGSYGHC